MAKQNGKKTTQSKPQTVKAAATQSAAGTFSGGYVSDLREVLVASALSNQNAMLIGAAGWGKTKISTAAARAMAGDGEGAVYFLDIDDSTPPEAANGIYDPARLLDVSLSEGERFKRTITGTPFDPRTRIALFDEIGRGNPALFNSLLKVLAPTSGDPDKAATCWATTNFMPTDNKVLALLDRFALWYWVSVGDLDIRGIGNSIFDGLGDGLKIDGSLPTWGEIVQVRAARPTAGGAARNAVLDVVQQLAEAATADGLHVHPRAATQWVTLLYRTSVYYTGTAEFAQVPAQAMRVLRYAHVAPTKEEYDRWQKIAVSVVDATGAAIEGIVSEAYNKLKEVADMPASARGDAVLELAGWLQTVQANLRQLGGNDPRVDEAISTTMSWYSDAARGRLTMR